MNHQVHILLCIDSAPARSPQRSVLGVYSTMALAEQAASEHMATNGLSYPTQEAHDHALTQSYRVVPADVDSDLGWLRDVYDYSAEETDERIHLV